MPAIISLTTDFGLKDGNVGAMKGVIWSIAPHVQIADLSHLINPQNVHEAALVVARAAPYFPDGTIHVVVVDPGVGTERRAIALRLGQQYFVGPDNGVFTRVLKRAASQGWPVQAVHLTRPEYWLPRVSAVFHGRDIFAPAAAHLAAGAPLEALGEAIGDLILLPLPEPQRTPSGWRGEVLHVDHFGNLTCSIRREHLGEHPDATIRIAGVKIHGIVGTFGERPPGELVALYGSSEDLILAVVAGSAAQRLNVKPGEIVEVDY
ncbi:MAG: SAM-dependent chlorinase/fluorinase [Anaerolineales bacterium]|nr:SAM-dependent chlorinase/fluorinase [Anaerolineales bacterium]